MKFYIRKWQLLRFLMFSSLGIFLLASCFQQSIPNTVQPKVDVFKTYISAQAIEPTQHSLEYSLFANGDFESIGSWQSCESASDITIEYDSDRKSNVLRTKENSCFYQSTVVEADKKLKLSCYAKTPDSNLWTAMGINFSDANWTKLDTNDFVKIESSTFNNYELITTAPQQTKYVSMWFYSEAKSSVDDCILTIVPDSPPTPVNNTSCTVNNNRTWSSVLYLPEFGNGDNASDYVADNIELKLNSDGTARLMGDIHYYTDEQRRFAVDISFSDRTTNTPQGNDTAQDGWFYYASYTGSLSGKGSYEGIQLELIANQAPALQVGEGANKQNQEYGAHIEMEANYDGKTIYLEWALGLACETIGPPVSNPPVNPIPSTGTAKTSGFVFVDNQREQRYSSGARGLSNVTLEVSKDSNNNNILDDSDQFVARTTTTENGAYSVDNLAAGKYLIEVTDESNELIRYTPTTPQPQLIELRADEETTQSFGYVRLASDLNTLSGFELLDKPTEDTRFTSIYAYSNDTLFIVGGESDASLRDVIFVYKATASGWAYSGKLKSKIPLRSDFRDNGFNGYFQLYAVDDLLIAQGSGYYVFQKNGDDWRQETKLPTQFGSSFISNGENIFIYNSTFTNSNGVSINRAIQAYKKVAGVWTRTDTEVLSGTSNFTTRLAVDGQNLFVSYKNNVTIYSINSNGELAQQAVIDLGSLEDPEEYYSVAALAVSGDNLAIGTNICCFRGLEDASQVRLFKRVGNTWQATETLTVPDFSGDGDFGASLSLLGNNLLVGAPGAPAVVFDEPQNTGEFRPAANGTAYLYTLQNGLWQFDTKFQAKDNQIGYNVKLTPYEALMVSRTSDVSLGVHSFALNQRQNLPVTASPIAEANGSISGRLFVDSNVNNQKDLNEEPLQNIEVSLYRDPDRDGIQRPEDLLDQAVTDSLGAYTFRSLPEDAYIVFVAPSSSSQSFISNNDLLQNFTPSNPSYPAKSIVLSSNQAQDNTNFNYVQRSGTSNQVYIGDRVWLDNNGNGIQERGERGVRNIRVNLYKADGSYVATKTTDFNGRFSFVAPPGRYYLQLNINERSTSISDAYGYTVAGVGSNPAIDSNVTDVNETTSVGKTDIFEMVAGIDNYDIDIGIYEDDFYPKPEDIEILVWKDISNDGIRDPFEPALPDIVVELIDDRTEQVITSAQTNTSGEILFGYGRSGASYINSLGLRTDIPYRLRFQIPAGFKAAPIPTSSVETDTVNTLPPNQSEIGPFFLKLGESFRGGSDIFPVALHKAEKQLSAITGRVWNDTNQNGIEDSGETGAANVELKLRFDSTSSGIGFQSVLTDSNGNYQFDNLVADNYVLFFSVPKAAVLTEANIGNDDTRDSDIVRSSFPSLDLALTEGETKANTDIGFIPLSAQSPLTKLLAKGQRVVDIELSTDNRLSILSTTSTTTIVDRQSLTTYQSYLEIFREQNNNWTKEQEFEFADNPSRMALSDNGSTVVVVVTEVQNNAALTKVRSYTNRSGNWLSLAEIASTSNTFNTLIQPSSDGSQLFIGKQVPVDNQAGRFDAIVEVYNLSSGAWQLQATLNASDDVAFPDTSRARSVGDLAVSGNTLVVGVRDNSFRSSSLGGAVVYQADNSGNWTFQQRFDRQGTGTEYAYFGSTVSISEVTVAIMSSNSIFFYRKNSAGTWVLEDLLKNVTNPFTAIGSTALDVQNESAIFMDTLSANRRTIRNINTVLKRNQSGAWQFEGYLEAEQGDPNNQLITTVAKANCKWIASTPWISTNNVLIYQNSFESCN